MKKVLVVGSGGREHALGWKLAQSDSVSEVLFAPGNAGTQEDGRNVNVSANDFPALAHLIESENIDLTVVGSEEHLAAGLVDYLHSRGHDRVFGPTQNAAQLEADKFFSFDLMDKLRIPQADSVKCCTTEDAIQAIKERTTDNDIVIKARWLTAGKGVTVCSSMEQAFAEIQGHSREYGQEVLVAENLKEEGKELIGQEFSVFGISDGHQVSALEIALQDHKPLFDGDRGPNTGGMGAYGPTPIAPLSVIRYVADEIMSPVVQRMKADGNSFKGFLYAGMIMTSEGPKVIEFNVRFGDPECQPAMMMLESDLYETLSLSLEGRLDQTSLRFHPGASCCVVLASQGYPKEYRTGLPITGLEGIGDGVKVFHSGTRLNGSSIVTKGGRVLGVTSYPFEGIRTAQRLIYDTIPKIHVPGGFHFRKDIGDKALK